MRRKEGGKGRLFHRGIDENTVIEEGAVVGEEKEKNAGIAVLGRNITIGAGAVVAGGQILDKDYKGE